MTDATGVSSFFEMVRRERAEAEKHNQPAAVVETKIEEKPATEAPAAAPAPEPPAADAAAE